MSNISEGSRFERDFCNQLRGLGFWVHRLSQNAGGQQPADVIAVKGRYHALIDCKVVSGERFLFSRVEDNQYNAMSLFEDRGNEPGWFAIRCPDGYVAMLSLIDLDYYRDTMHRKSISCRELKESRLVCSLDDWNERAKEWM